MDCGSGFVQDQFRGHAIGVAGEFVGNWVAGPIRKRLEASKDLEIAALNKAAGEAQERAAKADEQSTRAGQDTAKASSAAAEANVRASKLEVEAAAQRERAAKAERDLLELQEHIAPRHITLSQQNKLKEDLRPLALKTVMVLTISMDPETSTFGDVLVNALKSAGVNASRGSAMTIGAAKSGVSIQFGTSRKVDANILAKAFIDAGLAPYPVPAEPVEDSELLRLTVGPKE